MGEPAGVVDVEFVFLDPPRGKYFSFLRVTIHSASNLNNSSTDSNPHVCIYLDETTAKTSAAQKNGIHPYWEESFDLPYELQQHMRFEVMDARDSVVCGTSLDLWAFVRKQNRRISGSLPLSSSNGSPAGILNFTLEFYDPPSPPFPEGLQVCIKGVNSLEEGDLFNEMDPFVKVKLGSKSERTRTIFSGGKSVTFDSDIYLKYEGENHLKLELWDSDRFKKDDHMGSGDIDLWSVLQSSSRKASKRVDLVKNGVVVGFADVDVKLLDAPQGHLPEYFCLTVARGQNLIRSNKINMHSFTSVSLGITSERTQSVYSSDSNPNWNCQLVFPYSGERISDVEVQDNNGHIGSGQLDLWSVLSMADRKPSRVVLPIFNTYEPAGSLVCNVEFFNPPPTAIPEGIRIIVGRGRNLSGAKMSFPRVKASLGGNSQQTLNRSGSNPDFNREELFLPIDFSMGQDVKFEAYSDNSSLLGFGSIMIWNVIRDVSKPWVGSVPLRLGKDQMAAGELQIVMQLVYRPGIALSFNTETPGFNHNHSVSVYEDDSLRTFKQKVS